jgi:hypothetical protein
MAAARHLAGALILAAATATAAPAAAQVDLFSPDVWHGVVDLRVAGADGERSFNDHGFGKLRFGGSGDGGWRGDGDIAFAALEWRPRFTWDLTGVVDVVHQPEQDEHPVDITQAYVSWRPVPTSATRFTARAGLYYPAISLEHDGVAWGMTNLITPSAINSWVGEEVKVVGVEAGIAHEFEGGQRLALTLGVFAGDDTAGTLLTYRGWALHDEQSTSLGRFQLPPRGFLSTLVQPDYSFSLREIDKRPGFYGRLEWRPAPGLELEAFYYDNRGDKVGITSTLQWAWATRFVNLGARWTIDEHTRVLAQALVGHTADGFPTPDGLFGDIDFAAAYGEVQRDVGRSTFTARADLFRIRDNTTVDEYRTDEDGWAVTAAWRYAITRHVDFRAEAVHVRSDRPGRDYAGLPDVQSQTQVQSSLRVSY